VSEQNKTPWPSLSALWSLLWRAVLLTPFAMLAGGLWLISWLLLIVLPILEILYLLNRDWLWASIMPPIWIGLFFLVRSRWFRAYRKDFPNDQENV
jgi:hypothetical protein